MLSTILLRWWKSLLKRLPPRKIKPNRERKPYQHFLTVFHAIAASHIPCATTRVQPCPSGEVKPSQGIVWPGFLFTHSTPQPSCAREARGSQRRRSTGPNLEDLFTGAGTGKEAGLAGSFLGRGVPSDGVEARWPLEPFASHQTPYPSERSAGPGSARVSGAAPGPALRSPAATNRPPAEAGRPGTGPPPHRARPRPT